MDKVCGTALQVDRSRTLSFVIKYCKNSSLWSRCDEIRVNYSQSEIKYFIVTEIVKVNRGQDVKVVGGAD